MQNDPRTEILSGPQRRSGYLAKLSGRTLDECKRGYQLYLLHYRTSPRERARSSRDAAWWQSFLTLLSVGASTADYTVPGLGEGGALAFARAIAGVFYARAPDEHETALGWLANWSRDRHMEGAH